MTGRLNGKVAAITGAASGIGLECARALLAQSPRVMQQQVASAHEDRHRPQPVEPTIDR